MIGQFVRRYFCACTFVGNLVCRMQPCPLEDVRRSPWRSNLGIQVARAIHGLQLPASQKDHAWSQTALTSDPVPDLRWVHRIKHLGCSPARNGTSMGSEIPRCVKSEVGIWSY